LGAELDAGLGQADRAGGADEQWHAHAIFELTHGLADCRGRDAKVNGCGTKGLVLGNAQESLDAVEEIAGDCVVLLH
jgi:hypothetical protein